MSEQHLVLGKQRNPGVVILLNFVTLGIYSLVWYYSLFDEAAVYARNRNGTRITSGGAAIGFLFIPVFNIVWSVMLWFKTPGLVTCMRQADGISGNDRGSAGNIGFFMLIPLAGPFIWIILTQNRHQCVLVRSQPEGFPRPVVASGRRITPPPRHAWQNAQHLHLLLQSPFPHRPAANPTAPSPPRALPSALRPRLHSPYHTHPITNTNTGHAPHASTPHTTELPIAPRRAATIARSASITPVISCRPIPPPANTTTGLHPNNTAHHTLRPFKYNNRISAPVAPTAISANKIRNVGARSTHTR